MADDRVFIRCNVCGKKLFLGKQFGWEAFYWENYGKTNGDPNSPPLEDRPNEFFREHAHPYSYKEHWYGNYSIVYESDNDSVEIVRCKDCKHRPIKDDGNIVYAPNDSNGWDDETCPCLCDDCYYNWMPDDDFFCKRGERREDDRVY